MSKVIDIVRNRRQFHGMRMLILTLLVLAVHAEAAVNPVCLKAVTGYWNPNEASGPEIQNVLTWIDVKLAQTQEYPLGVLQLPEWKQFLEKRGIDWREISPESAPEFVARFYFEQWQKWDDVNRTQRDAYLNLELDQLEPVPHQRPTVLGFGGGYSRLQELSAKNSARLLSELQNKYPEYKLATPEARETVEKLLAQLNFNYLSVSHSRLTGQAPLVSPNALTKLDLGLLNPFYSSLMGGSNMVNFHMYCANSKILPAKHDGDDSRDFFRLNSDFAFANGMILPVIRNPPELYEFVAQFDSAAATRFLERNRDLIPGHIKTPEEILSHLKTVSMDYIFPQDKQYERLYLLRSRLIDFVTTAKDGEAFVREAFRIYLLHLSVARATAFAIQSQELTQTGGALQNIMLTEFFPFIGWPKGAALQVPVSVPASAAPRIRVEAWP